LLGCRGGGALAERVSALTPPGLPIDVDDESDLDDDDDYDEDERLPPPPQSMRNKRPRCAENLFDDFKWAADPLGTFSPRVFNTPCPRIDSDGLSLSPSASDDTFGDDVDASQLEAELTAMEHALGLSRRFAHFEEEQRNEERRQSRHALSRPKADLPSRRASLQAEVEELEIEVFDRLARGDEEGAGRVAEDAERLQSQLDALRDGRGRQPEHICPDMLNASTLDRLWELVESHSGGFLTIEDFLLRSFLTQELRHDKIIPDGAVLWKEEPEDENLHRLKEMVRTEEIRKGLNCGMEALLRQPVCTWSEEDKERARLRIAVGMALKVLIKKIVT